MWLSRQIGKAEYTLNTCNAADNVRFKAHAAPVSNRMITFQISGYLTEFTGGHAEIKIEGGAGNVGDALQLLWNRHAGLRDRVLTERGEVRPHVNLFVNGQVTRRDQALQIPIADEGEICIMPAVSGG
jgi:molybdopterin synthase sulfur carrier subunit